MNMFSTVKIMFAGGTHTQLQSCTKAVRVCFCAAAAAPAICPSDGTVRVRCHCLPWTCASTEPVTCYLHHAATQLSSSKL